MSLSLRVFAPFAFGYLLASVFRPITAVIAPDIVKDIGVDADPITFIKEAEAYGADIIGASSLMTTTMPHQKEMIDILKDEDKRNKYKVVVGGAPTTVEWAEQIGADLYAPDAGSASKLLADLLKK